MFWNIVSLVLVGFLWGATNPFLKLGSKGIEKIKSTSRIGKFLLEIKFLATRWQYLIPFLLNQSGSVLYVLTLQKSQLSLAVPLANSLSFVFTAISAQLLGEESCSKEVYIGTALVIAGSSICAADQIFYQ